MKFYAVTERGSLYLVSDKKENGIPLIQKIIPRKKGKWGRGKRFSGGTHVGIGTFGWVHLFNRRQGKSADCLNTSEFGGHTSQVVALFLTLGKAMKCWKCCQRKRPWDRKWMGSTRKTLRKIGSNHQVFILSKHSLIEDRVSWE